MLVCLFFMNLLFLVWAFCIREKNFLIKTALFFSLCLVSVTKSWLKLSSALLLFRSSNRVQVKLFAGEKEILERKSLFAAPVCTQEIGVSERFWSEILYLTSLSHGWLWNISVDSENIFSENFSANSKNENWTALNCILNVLILKSEEKVKLYERKIKLDLVRT